MNVALSPARHADRAGAGRPHAARRHPVGLMIVVGLHVLVAGALLTAKSMRSASTEPPAVAILPEPEQPPKVVKTDRLEPPRSKAPVIYAEPPKFRTEPDPTAVTTTDTRPALPPDTHIDGGGEQKVAIAEPVRFKPRAGFLSAGAAQCRPDYPAAAQRAGTTGVSRIRFTIDASGKVTNPQILQPSGPTREHRLLDQAAAAALAQCPVTVGTDETGHPVASTADVDYVWTLD